MAQTPIQIGPHTPEEFVMACLPILSSTFIVFASPNDFALAPVPAALCLLVVECVFLILAAVSRLIGQNRVAEVFLGGMLAVPAIDFIAFVLVEASYPHGNQFVVQRTLATVRAMWFSIGISAFVVVVCAVWAAFTSERREEPGAETEEGRDSGRSEQGPCPTCGLINPEAARSCGACRRNLSRPLSDAVR
jgi:hypothetical protein